MPDTPPLRVRRGHRRGTVECLLIALSFAFDVLGATVQGPPLWGHDAVNNSGEEKLFKDYADQSAFCRALEEWDARNARWAEAWVRAGCTLLEPQPQRDFCLARCGQSLSSWPVQFYCGLWDVGKRGVSTDPSTGLPYCPAPSPKNPGPPPCCDVGNPIHAGYGNKYEEQIDYAAATESGLQFSRSYNSKGGLQQTHLGPGWRSNYDRVLALKAGQSVVSVFAYRSDGRVLFFSLMKDGRYVALAPYDGSAVWTPDSDISDRLWRSVDAEGNTTGWSYYVASSEETESYDPAGNLLAITSRSRTTHTLTRDGQGRVVRVTDSFGRQLAFSYDGNGRLTAVTDPAGAVYRYGYDAAGRLATVAFPDGAVRGYVYNEAAYTQGANLPNALTGIVDELGTRYATFGYNTQGDAVSTEHAGGVARYSIAYNFSSGVSTVTDPLGTIRTYNFATILGTIKPTGLSQPCPVCAGGNFSAIAYDANGNVTSRTNFNDKKTCHWYDERRNLEIARVEGLSSADACTLSPPSRPDVRKITTTWHATYRLPVTIVEPAPGGTKTTRFDHDVAGNVIQKTVTAPRNDGTSATLSRIWRWAYGTLGRLTAATDPNGNVTRYSYYPDDDADVGRRGNLAAVVNPVGHTTTIDAYDAHGRPLSVTDPNGLVTAMTYDARGRITSRSTGSEVMHYAYDGVGQLIRARLPDGSTLAYTYDGAHRLVRVADGLGNRIDYTLDATGNRTREEAFDPTNTLAYTHARVYDGFNRLAHELGALDQRTAYARDANGNVTLRSDPLGHATSYAYDALDRRVQQIDAAGGVTRYRYDDANNLVQVTDARGLATTYGYDGLGNLGRLISPDTGTTTSTYDDSGNVLMRTDARGATAASTYDALNRVTQTVFSSSSTKIEAHAFAYDVGSNAKGRLTSMTDPTGTTSWTYTVEGRVASKVQTVGGVRQTLVYSYNASGQLAGIVTPSGQQIGYAYLNNRLTSVTVNGTPVISAAVTEPFAGMAAWRWGNGLYTFRTHDADGRIASWEFRNGVPVLGNSLAFDAASRIVAIQDPLAPSRSATYRYDEVDRLTVALYGEPVTHALAYAYDELGNRLSTTVDGAIVNLAYEPSTNRLKSMAGILSPSYLGGATSLAFTYNNANRLIGIQGSDAPLAAYAVNALGQRVRKETGGVTTHFVYDELGRLIGEYDGSGSLIQETVWLEGLPIATLRPAGAGNSAPVRLYYVHADHLGTPRAVTHPTDNAIVWRWDNADPFGANPPNEDPNGLGPFRYNLRFPGQYYDSEIGTNYNYFRDYDSSIGRYIESDTIGLAGGLNLYAYGEGAPTAEIDPLGLAVFTCMQPLHFLGGHGLKSGPDVPGNPLYHNYLCVRGPDGGWICGGQDRLNGPFGPGKPSVDSYKPSNCSQIAEDNACNDQCLLQKVADPSRPNYWLIGGGGRRGGNFNCQQWVEKIVSECKRECTKSR